MTEQKLPDVDKLIATTDLMLGESQRYQRLFELAPDGYLVTDSQGTIWEANRAAARLLEALQPQLVGKSLLTFVVAEERQAFYRQLVEPRQKDWVQEAWEVKLQLASRLVNVALTVGGVCNQEGALIGWHFCMRDITTRKQTQEKLQESERLFRQLTENIHEVFWIFDFKKKQTIYISPAYEKIWGRTCQSLYEQPQSFLDAVQPQDRDRVIDKIEKQRCGEITQLEYQIVRPDGSRRWISDRGFPIQDNSGQVYRVCGIAEDITQFKQVQETLRQQIEREQAINKFTTVIRSALDLETIFTNAAQEISPLLQVDKVEIQQYLPVPQLWLTVANYGQNPDQGNSLGVKVLERDQEISRQLKQFKVVRINDTDNLENPETRELAKTFSGAWLLVPLYFQGDLWGNLCLIILGRAYDWQDAEVELVSVIATNLAIAIGQAQLYQQLNTLNTALEHQVQKRTIELKQKIQELEHLSILKDDFLSTVSHELRTPLANMKMAMQMLKVAPSLERQQRYLEILQAECNRETELIDDLLDLQRLEMASYPTLLDEAINLQNWLPAILEPFHSRALVRQLTLDFECSANLPPLISNKLGIERILVELLNNACKYTAPGGRIRFCVHHDCDRQPPVTIFIVSNQAEIPAAELARIFDKFYRVPHADPWKQGGTGLGLALVQKLVEQLKGKIQATSGDGWTSFTVEIPY